MELAVQILISAVLIGTVAYGFQRIRSRYGNDLNWQQQGLLLLTILTLMGGFLGSPFWWFDLEESFSWDLPPLASRMLASAGWAFVVVSALALLKPTYRRLRLVLLMLSVYLTPLAIVIVLAHLDRFDFGEPISYAFFSIVLSMVIPCNWYLFQQPKILPDDLTDTSPSSERVRLWLWGLAAINAIWGIALFITDDGPSDLIWVWPGDLLTSRLIAVMLLTIAVGAYWTSRHKDVSRIMLLTITVYGIGLVVATLWNLTADLPIKPAYVFVFGIMAIGSISLWYMDRPIRSET